MTILRHLSAPAPTASCSSLSSATRCLTGSRLPCALAARACLDLFPHTCPRSHPSPVSNPALSKPSRCASCPFRRHPLPFSPHAPRIQQPSSTLQLALCEEAAGNPASGAAIPVLAQVQMSKESLVEYGLKIKAFFKGLEEKKKNAAAAAKGSKATPTRK